MNWRSFGAVVVGPNVLIREGLAGMLRSGDLQILASAASVDAIGALPRGPLLLIIDVADDFNSSIEQIERFKRQHPTARIALLGRSHQLDEMVSAFRAGANAYFAKVPSYDAFLKSLELVVTGVTILPPEYFSTQRSPDDDVQDEHDEDLAGLPHPIDGEAARVDGDQHGEDQVAPMNHKAQVSREAETSPHLSGRQRAILNCLLDGDSNKTIARRMAIAEATVKVHVKAILRKIRVRNRTQAAIWAMNHGPLAAVVDASVAADLPVRGSPPTVAAQPPNGINCPLVASPTRKLGGANHVEVSDLGALVSGRIIFNRD